MLHVLLVVGEGPLLAAFETALNADAQIAVRRVASGREAMVVAESGWPAVVATAEQLADGPALPLVKALMKRFPLINCAMVSSLPAEEFHEATEGLGLFMQLPANPGAEEAARMLALLRKINALLGD